MKLFSEGEPGSLGLEAMDFQLISFSHMGFTCLEGVGQVYSRRSCWHLCVVLPRCGCWMCFEMGEIGRWGGVQGKCVREVGANL